MPPAPMTPASSSCSSSMRSSSRSRTCPRRRRRRAERPRQGLRSPSSRATWPQQSLLGGGSRMWPRSVG
eukprot:12076079-Alexandrium_andersonii.AAC.1